MMHLIRLCCISAMYVYNSFAKEIDVRFKYEPCLISNPRGPWSRGQTKGFWARSLLGISVFLLQAPSSRGTRPTWGLGGEGYMMRPANR